MTTMGADSTEVGGTRRTRRELPPGPGERRGDLVESLRYGAAFFMDPFGFVGGRFARYGDVYYAPAKGVPLYVLRHPDHLREVLITRADDYAKSHSALESLAVVLGDGLLTTDGELWRRHRRILNPAFTRRAIDAALPRMAREARMTADALPVGRAFDPTPAMVDLTLRIVGHALLGIDLAEEVALVGKSMNTLQTLLAVPRSLPGPLRWPVDRSVKRAVRALDGVIERVIDERRRGVASQRDLLQMLLDATDPESEGSRLTAREVRDELVTFLLAGHETTSNTLAWALYLLAKHPEVQRAVHAEIDRVVGQREITGADVDALELVDRVVAETMRLYPPAYMLARRAIADTSVGPWDVPAGAEVVLWLYFAHRDARWYPSPEAFDPSRFTEAAIAARPKLSYLPFGGGARACIGKVFATVEATVALATLLQRYTFEQRGEDRTRAKPRITLTPTGLALHAVPR